MPTLLVATQLYVPALPLLTVLIRMSGSVPAHVTRDTCYVTFVPRLTHNLLTVSVQVFDPLDCRWRVRIHLVVKSILFSEKVLVKHLIFVNQLEFLTSHVSRRES